MTATQQPHHRSLRVSVPVQGSVSMVSQWLHGIAGCPGLLGLTLALGLCLALGQAPLSAQTTSSTGQASPTAFSNTQPTLTLKWFICYNGIFPTADNDLGSNAVVGELRLMAGNALDDTAWLECNGQTLNILDYQVLYAVILTTYGGNGTTTFAIPDMRGRVPVGTTTGYTLGSGGGAETLTLSVANLPAHTHSGTGSTGSGTALNNDQPSRAIVPMIMVSGDYIDLGWVRFFAFNRSFGDHIVCDGRTLTISSYTPLFSKVGTTYGGNGSTNFGIPDLRGRTPIGSGQGSGLTNRTLGATVGSSSLSITTNQMPTHTISGNPTSSAGLGQAHDTMQASQALQWIVATSGLSQQSADSGALGEVRLYAPSSLEFAPTGFVSANGASLTQQSNGALYAILGTTYGGSGGNFNLPDLRGRTATHAGQGTGLTSRTRGDAFGAETVTLVSNNLPAHSHPVVASPPTVTLSASPTTIAEAAGTSTITATLSAAATTDTTVTIARKSTSTAALTEDFILSSPTITILAGQTTGTATLTAVQDSIDEADESAIIEITAVSGGDGATESGTQEVTVTITDDDLRPVLSIANVSQNEGDDTSNMTFTITLSPASGREVIVEVRLQIPPNTGEDYDDISNLTFSPGQTTATYDVQIIGNTVVEEDRTFSVYLYNPDNNATFSGGSSSATGTIIDDDSTPPVVDLNGSTGPNAAEGDDVSNSFSEGGGALAFAPSATITDDDSNDLVSLTVTLTNRPDGASEGLSLSSAATTAAIGLTVTAYNSSTGVLSITGSATVATYQTILQGVQYNNTSNTPSTSARLIDVVVSDGSASSTSRRATVSVSDVTYATTTSAGFNTTTGSGLSPAIVFGSGDEILAVAEVGHITFSSVASGGTGTDTLILPTGASDFSTGATLSGFEIINLAEGATVTLLASQLHSQTIAINGSGNNGGESLIINGTNDIDEIDLSALTIDADDITSIVINGLANADTITGTSAADTIVGGAGPDNLTGGNGNDVFSGTVAHLNGDTINDLTVHDEVRIEGSSLGIGNVRIHNGALEIDSEDITFASVEASITLSGNGATLAVASVTQQDGNSVLSFTTFATIETVFVGNAGNTADATGYGAVSYDYYIGTYEVTNAQYAAFLNSVAATDDFGLYNPDMGTEAYGGITQSGDSGNYTYSTRENMANKPVTFVSFWDAARFANWLTTGNTETGVYVLTTNGIDSNTITRDDAAWQAGGVAIASENEWYKAAYYDGAGDYWLYPTQSDSAPTIATANSTGDVSNPGDNVANYNYGADWNSQNGNVTTVGSTTSASHYGTFDQGGNVWEWNETIEADNKRGRRGGSFNVDNHTLLQSSTRRSPDSATEANGKGFRVSSLVPIAPEVGVTGNAQDIADGSATPSTDNHTDFALVAVGASLDRTFTITNTGLGLLNLSSYEVSDGDFALVGTPPSSVTASGSATFTVRFTPSATGTSTATLSFTTNDADENPFNFSISGFGNVPPTIDLNGAESGTGVTVALSGTTTLTPSAEVTDAENDAANWANGTLTVQRWNTTSNAADPSANDELGIAVTESYQLSGDSLQVDRSGWIDVATGYSSTGGVLSLTFTANALDEDVDFAVRNITLANSTPYGDATYRFTISDGSLSASADATVTSSSIFVDQHDDDADGDAADGFSLREALAIATGGETIDFAASLNGSTITLGSDLTVPAGTVFRLANGTSFTISGSSLILSGGLTINNDSSNTLTLISNLADNDVDLESKLTKTGAGTLILSGTNNTEGSGLNLIEASDGTLQISAAINLGSGDVILNGGVTFATAGNTLTITNIFAVQADTGATFFQTAGGHLTLSGNVNGDGRLTKSGGGSMTLAANNDAFDGGVTINNGTLNISSANNLGYAGPVTLNGGTLAITAAATIGRDIAVVGDATISNSEAVTLSEGISGTGTLTKTGSGVLTLTKDNNSHTGPVVISAGTLAVSSGSSIGDSSSVTVESGATLSLTGGAETIGSLTGAGAVSLTYTLTMGDNTDTTFSGVISSTNTSGIVKTGSGTLTLSGNNTYTGSTTVSAGGLTLDRAGGALSDTTAVTVNVGATLTLNHAESIGSLAGAGSVALGSNTLTTGGNGTNTTFSGSISGSGGLTKTGVGALTLSGESDYQGSTSLSQGVMIVGHASALGTADGNTTISSGTTMRVANGVTLPEPLTISGSGVNAGFGALKINEGTGSATVSGDITLAANTYIGAFNTGDTLTLSGTISDGESSFSLTKVGSGTVVLAGSGDYGGITTVSTGTLRVTGTYACAVTVNSGTTLEGTGSVGRLTVSSGGTLSPGVSGPGIFTVNGNLAIASGATLSVQLNGATAGTGHDQLAVDGTVDVTDATLSASQSDYTPSGSDVLTIIDNDPSDAIAGAFSGLAQNAAFTPSDGSTFAISYVGGTGNDVVLIANRAPGTPTLDSPVAYVDDIDTQGHTLNPRPRLIWTIPSDDDNNPLHFKVTIGAETFDSATSQTGFEYFDGSNWVSLPSTGAPSTAYTRQARYKPQADIAAGTVTWTVLANDGIVDGAAATSQKFIRAGFPATLSLDEADGRITALQAPDFRIYDSFVNALRDETNRARNFRGLADASWTESIVANQTLVQARHISDLRTVISGVTVQSGEPAPTFGAAVTENVTLIATEDFIELRNALDNL